MNWKWAAGAPFAIGGALLTMVTCMLPCECCLSSNTSTVQDRVHLRLGFEAWTPQQPQK